MLDALSMINPAELDTNLILMIDQLQRVEDPRVRFAVLTYLFTLYLDAIGVDRKRALEIADRGVRYAREHNTSEIRGLDTYFKKECM